MTSSENDQWLGLVNLLIIIPNRVYDIWVLERVKSHLYYHREATGHLGLLQLDIRPTIE